VAQILAGALVITSGLLPMLALAIIGILDTWYDYRRLNRATPAAGGDIVLDQRAAPGAGRRPQATPR